MDNTYLVDWVQRLQAETNEISSLEKQVQIQTKLMHNELQDQYKRHKYAIQQHRKEIMGKIDEITKLESTITKTKTQLKQLQDSGQVLVKHIPDIENLNTQLKECTYLKTNIQQELDVSNEKIKQGETSLREKMTNIQTLEQALITIKAKHETCKSDLKNENDQNIAKQEQYGECNKENEQFKTQIDDLTKTLSNQQTDYDSCVSNKNECDVRVQSIQHELDDCK